MSELASALELARIGQAQAPGTCGEWIQGWLDGEPVLVSCPIDRYASARVTLRANGVAHITPPDRAKALEAGQAVLALRAHTGGADIQVVSPLPLSRGYASSTADVVAVCSAAAAALSLELPAVEIARLACHIEPSDSIMFPGLTLLAYRSGRWHQPLGAGLRRPLVILDTGERIDTVAFNRTLALDRLAALEAQTRKALAMLQEGLQRGNLDYLGAAARLSALAYQAIRYSDLVERAAAWAIELGAGGPVRAHSGSIAGLLFEDLETAMDASDWLRRRFSGDITLAYTLGEGEVYP